MRSSFNCILGVVLCLFSGSVVAQNRIRKFSYNSDGDGTSSGYVYNKLGTSPGRVLILDNDHMAHYIHSRKPFPYNNFDSHSFVVSQLQQDHPPVVIKYRTPPQINYRHANYHSSAPVLYGSYKKQPEIPHYARTHEGFKASPVADVEQFNNRQVTYHPSPIHYESAQIEDHSQGHGQTKSEDFNEKGGLDFGEDHHNEKGEKESKDYESEQKYHKGNKGEHFKDDHSGHYDEEKGNKKSHYDEEDDYGEHHEEKKGEKGGKFGEKKGHKKGSKTTGYHNTFHKDEYKKDHTFYDNADHKGHFHKYGNDDAHHHKKQGDNKKGAKHDSAFEEKKNAKKGQSDKGHYDEEDKGYKKKDGHDEHHEDKGDYSKKGGSQGGKEFAFKEGHHHH